MRMFALLLFSVLVSAQTVGAPWDGTKGDITVATSTGPLGLTVKISSSNTDYRQFLLTVWHRVDGVQLPQSLVTVSTIGRNGQSMAFLPFQESEIVSMFVTEFKPGETQVFTASAHVF